MSNSSYVPDAVSSRLPGTQRLEQTADAFLKVVSSWLPHGTDIFERDWDVLVILDTCRADAIAHVASEYDFVTSGTSVWSRGSATREWVPHTFTASNLDEVRDTALVTANPTSRWGLGHEAEPEWPEFAKRLTGWDTVEPTDFEELDEVWRYGPTNPYSGTVVPAAVTDRAISTWRSTAADRMIVHYLPPHQPYGHSALRENRPLKDIEKSPWQALKNGTPKEDVWDLYLEELRSGLDSVATLIEDIEADDIVITADHGEAFGEFGLYAHPMIPIPALREVPWIETTGQGRGEYSPWVEPSTADTDVEDAVEEQLEMLGYR
ncbi:hypothetical protein [Haloarcula onubensis]|uniref:Sulfatase n=1 Tax=Haloarcula onubensis TaxID=2950539 RepID=A0ABU2FJ63_9EURY|nr:hypothetical protein [Halomicroarcula sp. S3CR25-11]MDS0280767.1 hypothetical protein [Halomicroarcula sp. S3CR25-11]